MEAFENFLTAIALLTPDGGKAVSPYGAFHLVFFALSVAGAAVVCIFCRNISEKKLRIILTATGFSLIALEIYKQLVLSYAVDGHWSYAWYAFPFQFCSTPMYVMPAAGLIKNGKLRDMLMSFLGTFSIVAGLSVMMFVGGVFDTPSLGVSIQSMLCHGSMIVIGALVLACERKKLGIRYWASALPVFLSLMLVAVIADIIMYFALPAGMIFDMFYLSPYVISPNIAVVTQLREALSGGLYFIYLFTYAAGFSLLALGITAAAKLISGGYRGGRAVRN